jgi:organic radical activating enzyme
VDWHKYKASVIDPLSPTFCGAKWLDSTIWLGHGATASCHLPPAHSIDVSQLAANPSAIHNTSHKKKMRKLMLAGERPGECDYCWKIEDVGGISDRTFKSHRYDLESMRLLAASDHEKDTIPQTLEIAFNRTCNFACAYCNAGFSTTWARDINTSGAYQNLISDGAGAYQHNGSWADPYGKSNEGNPYVDAFWRWWPELSSNLKQLRITGGEPLMSTDVWKLFDLVGSAENEIQLAVNTNLGAKPEIIQRLIESSHSIKNLQIYTSNESVGAQAEYIRDGLDYASWG